MKNKNYSVDVEAIASQYVKEENYWLNKLSGDLVKSGFPYDGPGKNTDEQEKRERVALQLDGEVFQKLNQLSNGSDIRLFMILAAALNVLLSVYSGEKDILIGAPIMKQDVEAEFVNTVLVLRNILGDTMSFKELLLQMRQCVTEAVDNVNYPLETLLYKLEGGRSGDDNTQLSSQENFPLFDTALLIENIQNMDYIRHISLNTVFSFLRTDTDIAGHLSYNPRLYRRETAQRIGGHFKHLVEYLVFNINAPVHMPDFLPDEEKELLVNGFNNTRREYPASKTLSELFEEQAAATPERFALKGGTCGGHGTVDDTLPEGGDTGSQAQLTYSQLNCKANQLASHLLQKGVRADTIVGIMTERSVEMIIGILGVLKAGGAYLPLDPDHPENRTAYMLKSSGVHVLLKQSTISGNFKDRCEVIDLDSNEWCRGSAENPGIKGNPRDLAYVIFTSGSTGNPKGVLVENRSVVNLIHWYARVIDVKANPNFVLLSSFTFDAGIEDIFTSLLMGGTLHVPGKDTILDREQFIKYVNGNRINSLNFVPTALKELLEDEEKPGSLDVIVSGGEELSGPLKDRFLDKGYRLYNSYGPTETTVDALLDKCSDKGVSLGKPMDNASVYILDKTGRHLLPIGINGELCISGLGVARGYLNNPELTAEKFIPNPYVSSMSLPDTLIYRTGDLARRLPDGNIEFSGRIDNQVKVRGFRIELGEIESRLLALGEIKEAVVSAKEEADGSKYLCAYIVKREAVGNIGRYRGGVGHNSKGPEDFSGIKEKLAAELPEYMVPAHFVCLDKMPLTPGGKLDKKALPEPEIAAGKDYIAPRTELEKKLVEIWAEILNSETSVIGINANFFDMGGHSLKATILASKIHKQWSVKFPLADIFENPTIAAMAKHIKGKKQDVYATIEATEKREYYRLSSAQSRLYFMQQMNLDGIGYNMSSTLYFDKDLDIVLLETAFKQLILKHESLRTSFRMVNEEPVQRIHEAVDFRIEYCQETTTGHWTWGGNRDSEAALSLDMPGFKEILRNFVRPFDLSIAPLLRAGLISVGDTKVLLLDMHHIVSDGASQELLSKEFQALMGGNPLPPLKLQYRDYSHWQNSMEQQERIAKHEGYWLNVFAGKIPQLNLPTDFPRSNAHTLEGDFRNFEIKPEHTRKLKEMCRENDATLFMNLLAIFNVFLHHYTGNSDIIVGCDVLGRPHSDLQDIIGMFVNMLPMRNTPTGDKTYLEFLKDVRDNSFEAFENQDMQFEKLVDRLGLPRQVSRNPLFDVQFALQTHAVFIDREKPELGGSMENADLQYIDKKSVFDLGLEAEETGEKIVFRLSYSTRLFKDETIERMVLYIKEIISAVIKNPGIAVSEIEMVSEEEERELLAIINESEERGNTVDMSEAPDNPGHSQAEFDF